MSDDQIDIKHLVQLDGRCPFLEWFDRLPVADRRRVQIRLVRARGGNLGDHHGVGGGVSELRLAFGPGYRVYYGWEGRKMILLICGGNKGTQRRDIQAAQDLWRNYREWKKKRDSER